MGHGEGKSLPRRSLFRDDGRGAARFAVTRTDASRSTSCFVDQTGEMVRRERVREQLFRPARLCRAGGPLRRTDCRFSVRNGDRSEPIKNRLKCVIWLLRGNATSPCDSEPSGKAEKMAKSTGSFDIAAGTTQSGTTWTLNDTNNGI